MSLRRQAEAACLEARRRRSYGEDVDTSPEAFANIAADIFEPEIERLRQGLWDAYRALGCDTDGDETPAAVRSDLVALVVDAAKEYRKDFEEVLRDR